ncbi:Ankyrin repeat family protein [Prunus dulcis]|uniref:Ankyrin repeat family protein n=1 Tax=Prunus dulcis TaxID=3755 RepID=A0A5H2XUT3_PRUDU|nr:Ankyrin repeat family protein [Prunus dulcis]
MAFFTSMMHVMVHLPDEALLAGPVNYRWMYPIERLFGELKKSVRNRVKPEGSIIEAWVQYESLTLCGMYLKDVETAFNRPQCNNIGGSALVVRNNCDEIMAYLDEHEEMMKREHPSHLVAQKHRELFPQWFLDSVNKLKSSNSLTYSDKLYNLAFGLIPLNCFRVVILTTLNFWGLHEMTSCVRKTAVSMSQVEAKVRTLISMANSQLSFNCFTKIDTK